MIVMVPLSRERTTFVQKENKNRTNELSVTSSDQLLRTNNIPNPSFEEVDIHGRPSGYDYDETPYAMSDAEYQGFTHAGSYSGLIEAQASSTANAEPELMQNFNAVDVYLNESITSDLYFYIEKEGALNQLTRFAIVYQTTNSSGYGITFHYVIDYGTYSPTNQTTNVYFMMNQTAKAWHNFVRNVTDDFYKAVSYLSSDTSRRISAIWFAVSVPQYVYELSSMLVDDVSLTNRTGYEMMTNGDFEEGTGNQWWWNNYSPGKVSTTTDCTDGNQAANLTSYSKKAGATGRASMRLSASVSYMMYYPTGPNTVTIEFDWKYSDTHNGGSGQNAYARFDLANQTDDIYLYYILGNDLDDFPFTNTSTSYYLKAPNFGSRNEWNSFSLDLWDIYQTLNITDFAIWRFWFRVNIGSHQNSSVGLLVDNFRVNAFTCGDPGFEVTFLDIGGDNLATWYHAGGAKVSRSTDAHSGTYSGNLTAVNNEKTELIRYSQTPIDPLYFFDASWKISHMGTYVATSSHVLISFQLAGGYTINYLIASTVASSFSNDSSHAYYYVENYNTTDTWITLHRNITNDLTEAFGVHDWKMLDIALVNQVGVGDNLTVLFDDVGFVEEVPPYAVSITQNPTQPKYYQETNISIQARDDLAGVKQVTVYYRTTGSWTPLVATLSTTTYNVTIPAQPYGQVVQYYVEMMDWCGNIGIDNNRGSYYSYTVGDDIAPTCAIDQPSTGATVSGNVYINASASDAGSGIAFVVFRIDGSTQFNDTTAPYETVWNSRSVTNGTHTIEAVAHDAAGLTKSDSITVNVQNDVAPPSVTGLVVNPTAPQYTDDVTISVLASDPSGIHNVTLYYRMNMGPWMAVAMAQTGSRYNATIPKQGYGTIVQYYIAAFDFYYSSSTLGNQTSPLQYTVGDNIAPTLSVSGPPTSQVLSGSVTFTITASDPGSGIQKVDLLVDGSLAGSTTGTQIVLNTTAYSNGNHTLVFRAYDNAGNTVEYSIEYQINNEAVTTTTTPTPGDILGQYGIFIVAGVAIIAIVIVIVVMKRRATK